MAWKNLLTINIAIMLIIPFLIGLIYVALQKGIKKEFFEKKIRLDEIEEDEILSQNNSQKIINLLSGKELIEEKEIDILKKNKIKEIIVMRNLPKFGPFIFIGSIVGIISPYLIQLLFI